MAKNPTLTVRLMHATARIAELEQQLAQAKTVRTFNKRVIAPRVEWTRPAWMEAARAQAMATGCVVLA